MQKLEMMNENMQRQLETTQESGATQTSDQPVPGVSQVKQKEQLPVAAGVACRWRRQHHFVVSDQLYTTSSYLRRRPA